MGAMTAAMFRFRTMSMTVLAAVALGVGIEGSAVAQTFKFAFQDSSNYIRIDNTGNITQTYIDMKPGTVPRLVTAGGAWGLGYQGSNGHFWEEDLDANLWDTGGWMAAGTSPSITILSGAIAFGFQAPNGQLWISLGGWNNGKPTGAYMTSGTSPSVAGLPNGNLAMAFRGSNGDLWVSMQAPGNGHDTKGFMAAGTSPSIAALPNNQIAYAFEGVNGSAKALWFGEGDGTGGTLFDSNLMPGSSPSVAADSSGNVLVAYQTSYGILDFLSCNTNGIGSCSFLSEACVMPSPTSPIVEWVDGAYLNPDNTVNPQFDFWIAFKGTNGHLWIDSPWDCQDQGIAMN
jgi:hypothetical protein